MHMRGCPKSGRMQMTIETTSYPANPHKVLVQVIYDALSRGRRKGGMSKKSIQSRIEQTYHCRLGVKFEKELTKSLKRLVRSHHLHRTGYRYNMSGGVPSNRGWRLNEALPVTCRCSRSCSRSSSRYPSSQRSCKPCSGISGVTTSSSQRQAQSCRRCRSRSRSRSTVRWSSVSRSRSRKRRGRTQRRRKVGRRKSKRRGRQRGRSRHSSRHGRLRSRSHSRSRLRSRSRSCRCVRRVWVIRSTSRTRGRSLTRRSRTTYSSRSQTRSSSRKRRRIQTRSASRSTNGHGARSPTPQVVVPVPKLDAKRRQFEPGFVHAIGAAASTSHSALRASPYPQSPSHSDTDRGRADSPARGRQGCRSSSVPARSRSRSPSVPPSSRSGFHYLPFLKPTKPALRQSAPQSPQSPNAPDTLTPKSMVKFLTQ